MLLCSIAYTKEVFSKKFIDCVPFLRSFADGLEWQDGRAYFPGVWNSSNLAVLPLTPWEKNALFDLMSGAEISSRATLSVIPDLSFMSEKKPMSCPRYTASKKSLIPLDCPGILTCLTSRSNPPCSYGWCLLCQITIFLCVSCFTRFKFQFQPSIRSKLDLCWRVNGSLPWRTANLITYIMCVL